MAGTVNEAVLNLRPYLRIMGIQVLRAFWWLRRYPMQFASQVIVIYLFFMGVFLAGTTVAGLSPSQALAGGGTAYMVAGFLMWLYAMTVTNDVAWSVSQEAQTGTLEQLYLSSADFRFVLFCRAVGEFAVGTLFVGAAYLVIALSTGVRLQLPLLPVAAIILLTVLGLVGFGFMMAALALLYKQVGQLIQVLQFVLMFFTGALAPLERLPAAVQVVGKTLPLTQGIKTLQQVVQQGKTLWDVTASGDVALLAANSALYLALGLLVYRHCDRLARERGTLGQY